MPSETTPLSPADEARFQAWARKAKIGDLDTGRYDYRGYWADPSMPAKEKAEYVWLEKHLPDAYKQHGHESFSAESRYSRGLSDGGRWLPGDVLVGPPMASHRKGK